MTILRSPAYVTTYCNQAHRLKDGKPIKHNCYILPPRALQLEMDGDYQGAYEVVRKTLLREHRGTKS